MTERIAVAELRTAVYRALVVEGASSGEAEAAAETCVRSEVHGARGLALAVAALGRVPQDRVGAHVESGVPARLVDPARRALVLQARMALDWLGAHPGEAIVLPGERGAAMLLGALPRGSSAVDVVDGIAEGGCAFTPAGDAVRLDGSDDPATGDVETGIVVRATAPVVGDVIPAAVLAEGWEHACAEGLLVDVAEWTALLRVADGYLVPEV